MEYLLFSVEVIRDTPVTKYSPILDESGKNMRLFENDEQLKAYLRDGAPVLEEGYEYRSFPINKVIVYDEQAANELVIESDNIVINVFDRFNKGTISTE